MTLAEGSRDVQVAALGALVAVIGLSLAFWNPAPPAADDQSLALVSRAVGDVKRRPAALRARTP